jgi:hypothetical protein
MEEIPNQWPISVLNLAYALYLQGFLNTLYSSVFSTTLRRERRREQRAHAIFCAPFAPFVLSSGNRFRQEPHPWPAHAQFLGLDAERFLQSLGSVPRVPRVAHLGHKCLGRHRSAGVGDDVDQHLLQIVPRAPVVFFVNLYIAQDLACGTFDDPIPHRMRCRDPAADRHQIERIGNAAIIWRNVRFRPCQDAASAALFFRRNQHHAGQRAERLGADYAVLWRLASAALGEVGDPDDSTAPLQSPPPPAGYAARRLLGAYRQRQPTRWGR